MLLFELLQVAIGLRDSLSHTPTEQEWKQLYDMAEKQAVTGVCFAAIEKLYGRKQVPPQPLLLCWIGAAEIIKQRNAQLDRQCQKLQGRFRQDGVQSSILKGQGVARYYADAIVSDDLVLLRQPGDIDVYVDCGRERAIQLAKNYGSENVGWDYKHLHLNVFKDTEVEVHYRVEVMLNLWKNQKLQRWFREHKEQLFCEHGKLVAPTTEFNLFYILLHIYRHFLYEGVGMRQLMDYYFVLRHADTKERTEVAGTLKEFGMVRFARGVMWVMQTVFALERQYMICEPLECEGRFILEEVMKGGNFGKHDRRLGTVGGKWQTVRRIIRHNIHLLAHYPSDVIWTPMWIAWHWMWKKYHTIREK